MPIAPISSLSFKNNYNQVNFEGKKKENTPHSSVVSNTLKAIPLATLIALSPLNSVNAQNQVKEEKLIGFEKFGPNENGSSEVVLFLSNDGNDNNAEIVTYATARSWRAGAKGPLRTHRERCDDINELYTMINTDANGKIISRQYYVSGPGQVEMLKEDKRERLTKYDKLDIEVSPEAFKYLKDVLSGFVKISTKSRIVEKVEDNYDDWDWDD